MPPRIMKSKAINKNFIEFPPKFNVLQELSDCEAIYENSTIVPISLSGRKKNRTIYPAKIRLADDGTPPVNCYNKVRKQAQKNDRIQTKSKQKKGGKQNVRNDYFSTAK